jgi:hypothetical protein
MPGDFIAAAQLSAWSANRADAARSPRVAAATASFHPDALVVPAAHT